MLAALGVGLAPSVAGCSEDDATPTPTGRSINVTFQNESDWTLSPQLWRFLTAWME